jgi:hypothetical protein
MSETETPPVAAKPKKGKGIGIFIIASFIGAILLKWSFIFFVVGMLPTGLAYLVDHDKNKYMFYTVAALNFSGVFPDMMAMSAQGGTFNAVTSRLSDITVWTTMYSAAALGWGIVWLSPIIASMALEMIYRGRIAHMETIQKRMEDEWGTEINARSRTE